MIEFKGTGFTYDGERFVLDGVDARIAPGRVRVHPGRQRLGQVDAGQARQRAARARRGQRHRARPRHARRARPPTSSAAHAGMVFQNPDDQLVASLIENDVAFGPENLGVPTDELRQRVADALADVGLQGFDKRETAALSGGQKQRVAIAGVLAMEPVDPHPGRGHGHARPARPQGPHARVPRAARPRHDRRHDHALHGGGRAGRPRHRTGRAAASPATARRRTCSCRPSCWNSSTSTCRSPPSCRSSCGRRGVPVGMHIETTTLKEELCRLLSKA